MSRQLKICFAVVACSWFSPQAFAQDKPDASAKIVAALQPFVDSHALAGAVTLVATRTRC